MSALGDKVLSVFPGAEIGREGRSHGKGEPMFVVANLGRVEIRARMGEGEAARCWVRVGVWTYMDDTTGPVDLGQWDSGTMDECLQSAREALRTYITDIATMCGFENPTKLAEAEAMLKDLSQARPLVLYGEPWVEEIQRFLARK